MTPKGTASKTEKFPRKKKKKNHSPTVFPHYFPAFAWQTSNTDFRLHSREAFPLDSQMRQGGIWITKWTFLLGIPNLQPRPVSTGQWCSLETHGHRSMAPQRANLKRDTRSSRVCVNHTRSAGSYRLSSWAELFCVPWRIIYFAGR